jgi:hypothetical protein
VQRLRDLESKAIVENLQSTTTVQQSKQDKRTELSQPNFEEVTSASKSFVNTQVLDVTQIPILEEYH